MEDTLLILLMLVEQKTLLLTLNHLIINGILIQDNDTAAYVSVENNILALGHSNGTHLNYCN